MRLPNGDPLPVVLLANKCDLVKTPLSEEVMNEYCKENGFLAWFATSAKENINIDEGINFLVENILVHGGNETIPKETNTVHVRSNQHADNANSTCC